MDNNVLLLVPLLARMNYFDFNYQNQDYVPFSRRKILPGDRLLTTCVWDTSSDNTTVLGGGKENSSGGSYFQT
jgi:hypothetical protein